MGKDRSIILTLAGEDIYPNTILLYGPPNSGKSVMVNTDLPDDMSVCIIDTTSTFPIGSNKNVIRTTDINAMINMMGPSSIMVIDDTFVLTANEVRQLFRAAVDKDAILILISQIRKFREERFYPYMEGIVKNANIWIRLEPIENKAKVKGIDGDVKIVEAKVERVRGEYIPEQISVPIYISNNRVHEMTYHIFDNIVKGDKVDIDYETDDEEMEE